MIHNTSEQQYIFQCVSIVVMFEKFRTRMFDIEILIFDDLCI